MCEIQYSEETSWVTHKVSSLSLFETTPYITEEFGLLDKYMRYDIHPMGAIITINPASCGGLGSAPTLFSIRLLLSPSVT